MTDLLFKKCTKCKELKLINKFHEHKYGRFGVCSICKICKSKQDKLYQQANKDKIKIYHKKWRQANKDKMKAYDKAYSKTHKTEKNEWKKANPESVKKTNRKASLKRRATLKGQLSHNMSNALYRCLKSSKNGKHTFNILGYTVDKLKKHLERTMPDGFTWGDYISGKLHVDHVTPISVFNFEKPEDDDFKKCFALKNLQLLPAFDNMSKSDKLKGSFQPSLIF